MVPMRNTPMPPRAKPLKSSSSLKVGQTPPKAGSALTRGPSAKLARSGRLAPTAVSRRTRLARTRLRARAPKAKRWIVARTDLAYRDYVRGFPCDVRGVAGHVCVGPIDPHHVKTRGSGGGDEANLTALCRAAHTELHQIGRHSFARKYGVKLVEIAMQRWQGYVGAEWAA
jgi:hypothetical protein